MDAQRSRYHSSDEAGVLERILAAPSMPSACQQKRFVTVGIFPHGMY